jgi:hypothetical protein
VWGYPLSKDFSAAIDGAGMRRKPVSTGRMDELKEILKRVRMALGEEDYRVMNAVVETLSYLTHLAKDKHAAEIYRILGSSKSEKTRRREKLWASANGRCWAQDVCGLFRERRIGNDEGGRETWHGLCCIPSVSIIVALQGMRRDRNYGQFRTTLTKGFVAHGGTRRTQPSCRCESIRHIPGAERVETA